MIGANDKQKERAEREKKNQLNCNMAVALV